MIRALRAQVYTGFPRMKVPTLRALSPADGRYADQARRVLDLVERQPRKKSGPRPPSAPEREHRE